MKITLLCAGGMSTSIIVQKMSVMAKEKQLDLEIAATSLAEFLEVKEQTDIFLLAPQVKYKLKEFEKQIAENQKIGVIDSTDYGRMQIENILDYALSL